MKIEEEQYKRKSGILKSKDNPHSTMEISEEEKQIDRKETWKIKRKKKPNKAKRWKGRKKVLDSKDKIKSSPPFINS